MAVISPPFLLGADGQRMSGRLARLSLSAAFRPAASGVQVVSGVLAGPPNTMGELALPSGTQLTVQPFRAVVQSALDATAGAYEVINDAQTTLAVTAQHATQFRRSLVVVRVDDSQVSGVASSPTTDRATLEILDGALAASSGATVLPAPAGSWLALGEILIPPTGQTVTLTPYNPRTGMRHGIVPVLADGANLPGHDGYAPLHDGQYRDHPTLGLQRGKGGGWGAPNPTQVVLVTPPTSWSNFSAPGSGPSIFERLHYRIVNGDEVTFTGVVKTSLTITAANDAVLAAAGYLPAAIRPQQQIMGEGHVISGAYLSPPIVRMDLRPDGSILYSPGGGYAAGVSWRWVFRYNLQGTGTS